MKIHPPLKKTSSSSYFVPPSPSTPNKVSDFEVKPDISYFPTILVTPYVESFVETPTFNDKCCLEKKFNLEFIFSNSRENL